MDLEDIMQMGDFTLNSEGFTQNSPFFLGVGDFSIGPDVFFDSRC